MASRAAQGAATDVVTLPRDASACRQAREWTDERLERLDLDPSLQHDVVLCVDELVANVVDHTFSAPVVSLTIGEEILVEVNDSNSVPPSVRQPMVGRPRGWGLNIVDRVADRWGSVVTETGGKIVWFSVPRHH